MLMHSSGERERDRSNDELKLELAIMAAERGREYRANGEGMSSGRPQELIPDHASVTRRPGRNTAAWAHQVERRPPPALTGSRKTTAKVGWASGERQVSLFHFFPFLFSALAAFSYANAL